MNPQTARAPAGETPLWTPSPERIKTSRLEAFRKEAEHKSGKALPDYPALWRWSVDAPEDFWNLVWDFCGVIGDKGPVTLDRRRQDAGRALLPRGAGSTSPKTCCAGATGPTPSSSAARTRWRAA